VLECLCPTRRLQHTPNGADAPSGSAEARRWAGMMKKILIVFVVLSAVAGALFIRRYLTYCGSDWVRTEFAALADAKASGAFDRGWLPPILPDGSTKIVEMNDVESNNGEGNFNFPPESMSAYIETMRANYGSLVTTNKTRIKIQLMTDNTRWTVDVDSQTGRGKYSVGPKR